MPPSSYFRAIHPFIRRLKDPNSCFSFRFFHTIDRPASESAIGMLSRLISAPPVTAAPSSSFKLDARVFGLCRKPSFGDPVDAGFGISYNSVACLSELVRDFRVGAKSKGGGVCCWGCNGLMCLGEIESGEDSDYFPRREEMVCKCFWASVGENSVGVVNSSVCFPSKGFRLSYIGSGSGCAAPDVSLEGSSQDEQLTSSPSSSDQKKLGERTLKLHSGSCYLPHPDKEETGGEDAHFICDELAIGVADGVGGWAAHGVDAGQYARELMSHSVKAIEEEPKGSIDPVRVLEKAYTSTKALGSSTACIIALTDQGLRAVNLGDSGFIVVRDGCTVFRSPVQQHDFNFTYQLESGNASDLPSAAQVFTVAVESGDAIVAGTDGLFDNLYNNEITAVVVHAIRAGLGPQVTAQKIAALARQRALDKNRQTPFSTAAQDAGYRYYGGKLDDITVVVSYVTALGS